MAVVRATRRLNALSRRSSSSSGFGSSTSGTRRGAALADFVAHRVLAGLEGAHEPLGLLLEDLAALVEPVARAVLRLRGHDLRPARELVAMLQELVAHLAPGLGREQKRRGGADEAAKEEPAEISCRVVAIIRHVGLLGSSRAWPRRRRNP